MMSTMTATGLRPRRRWYGLAAAVAVLGLILGIVLLVVRIRVWTDEFPTLGGSFRPGETVSVDLRADTPVVLYVSPTESVYDVACSAEGADAVEVSYTFTFFSGGRSWAAHSEIVADRAFIPQRDTSAAELFTVGDLASTEPDQLHAALGQWRAPRCRSPRGAGGSVACPCKSS